MSADLNVKEGSEILHGRIHGVGQACGKLNNELADLTRTGCITRNIIASSYQLSEIKSV